MLKHDNIVKDKFSDKNGKSDCLMSMQKLNIYNQATIWNLDSCTYYDFQNVIEYPDLNQIYCAWCRINSKTGKLMLWM